VTLEKTHLAAIRFFTALASGITEIPVYVKEYVSIRYHFCHLHGV
jgi:hypothetical protein